MTSGPSPQTQATFLLFSPYLILLACAIAACSKDETRGRCVMAARERVMESAIASGTTFMTNLAIAMSIQTSCDAPVR